MHGNEILAPDGLVLVEQDEEKADHNGRGWTTDNEIQEAITAAIAQRFAHRTDTVVGWQSMGSESLDELPNCGRCAVCNRWVYDAESCAEDTPGGICRGAIVAGQLLCDEHLPEDHPIAF